MFMLNLFEDDYDESNTSNIVNFVRLNTDIYGNIIKDFTFIMMAYYMLKQFLLSFSYLLNVPTDKTLEVLD